MLCYIRIPGHLQLTARLHKYLHSGPEMCYMYTQKNKCWIYVYFTHRFNAQTNYRFHAMCKMPLVQQVANIHGNSCQLIQQLDIDISTWCNLTFFECT